MTTCLLHDLAIPLYKEYRSSVKYKQWKVKALILCVCLALSCGTMHTGFFDVVSSVYFVSGDICLNTRHVSELLFVYRAG